MRCASSDWRASRSMPQRKARFKAVMMELSRLSAKFEENVLDSTNAWTHAVRDRGELAGINEGILEQARRRAAESGQEGWLFGLDQPSYVAVVTDAESAPLRRAFYEAWTTRASERGPTAGKYDNSAVMEDILRLRHESAQLLGFTQLCRLRTRQSHGPNGAGGHGFPAPAGARGEARGSSGAGRTRALRGPQAGCLGCHLLLRTAAAEPLLGVAGGTARLPAAATRAAGTVRGGREAVRRAHSRTQRRAHLARRCALL